MSIEMFDTDPLEQTFTAWTLVELVEAATGAGENDRASAALEPPHAVHPQCRHELVTRSRSASASAARRRTRR